MMWLWHRSPVVGQRCDFFKRHDTPACRNERRLSNAFK
jgi:hypothetical protein